MASKIPPEILIKILNNVQSTQDLYSSLFVNRIWCKVTIPILWELPLGQEYRSTEKLKKKALCIRTYISCMDTQARTLLIQNGFDLSSSPPRATFDYPSFTHKVMIFNLFFFVFIYSPQNIGSYQHIKKYINSNEIIITEKSKILFREIYKLIINRCTFLNSFKMTEVPKIFSKKILNNDLIGSILKLPGAPKVFKKLESFTSMIRNDSILIRPLYESLALICHDILNMDLELNSKSQVELLGKLISVQKRLENLSISDKGYMRMSHNLFLWDIISQKETLKNLRLKSVNFSNFVKKSSTIEKFTSIQELYIENCHGLYIADSLFFASSFTQLRSFHYFHSSHRFNEYPQDFIIKILETANINLKNVSLDLFFTTPPDILLAILFYCTKITELTLHNLSPEQVIAISSLWDVISQIGTLRTLRLKSVNFYNSEEESSSIVEFISLQELYIENCHELCKSDCLSFASSFTQLSSFHYFHSRILFNEYTQNFIIKILETANTNLKDICLDLCLTIPSEILSAILNYCTKIAKLTLHNLSPEQVIAIFNNNFQELRRFSFGHGMGLDANKLLCQISKNVPESLETIEIRMGIFSADSLRKFFEGWCHKRGGGNKMTIIKHHVRRLTLSDEHWKVIKEYGVQFDLE
ncbi:2299_t:CDS:1 [Diversispora eburnea]|uniref:2299_t:CDS:1 n=1 Tax=Diversispora eburnea TaxID=1213867 RepID=A0A9N9B2B0_9GLOM|nr:2299_t:CDS:1 [Diversispora eburnea]